MNKAHNLIMLHHSEIRPLVLHTFNSARAVWSKDVNLMILKSDALMAEKSEETELDSVSRHSSCKNKRLSSLSTNVTSRNHQISWIL